MICPKCAVNNSKENSFCMQCGASLSAPTEYLSRPKENSEQSPQSHWLGQHAENLGGLTLDGKYQLEGKIGTGGVGAVYLATRLHIGDKVAVKVLRKDRSEDMQSAERFRLEARMAAHLKHPNAVVIYDYGVTANDFRYLVMELVEGRTLRQLISQQGALPISLCAEINTQICSALNEAHSLGLIHRDIKPDNIIVQETPTGPRIKILDFGIAKLSNLGGSNLTLTGTIVGTPRYMSPEQCMGEQLDGRSDIYSLGIVLYEMLCGIVPFNAPSSTAIAVQHVTHEPPSLRQINPNVPPIVESVVLRALAKKRDERPATAADLAGQFNAAANDHQPILQSMVTSYRNLNITDDTPPSSSPGSPPKFAVPFYPSPTGAYATPEVNTPAVIRENSRNVPVMVIAALAAILVFGGIGSFATWLWLRAPGDAVKITDNRTSTGNLAYERKPTENNSKNVNTSPTVNSADDELASLRRDRLNASPSQTATLVEKLEKAGRKYPNDYRFPFERTLAVAAGSQHHSAFSALAEAARTAIKNNQASQLSGELLRYKASDLRRISNGHKEWAAIENALNQKDAGLLPKDEH